MNNIFEKYYKGKLKNDKFHGHGVLKSKKATLSDNWINGEFPTDKSNVKKV